MKLDAVIKAQQRLQKAELCLGQIENSQNYAEFELGWTDLLIALNTIYTSLEQGAKVSPQMPVVRTQEGRTL